MRDRTAAAVSYIPSPPTHTNTQQQANVTGIWDPRTLRTTLEQLRALETNVDSVLGSGDGKGGTQSSSFKLNMLAEVLSLLVPPLAEAAGVGEGVMEMDG